MVYENWSVSRAVVSSSDQRQLATATAVGWIGQGVMITASPGKPAFIEHARFALDQPHEWFLDRSTGTLTYLAAPGENPAQAVAVETQVAVRGVAAERQVPALQKIQDVSP